MKTIVISGGSSGLGKAMAARLAKKHKVIILSPHEDKLQKVAEEVGCEYMVCDVRDYAQTEKVAHKVGEADVLINNAGLWITGPLEENDPARIHEVLEVNTLGTVNLTKAMLPALKQQKSGHIINIISTAGRFAKPERSVYAASKYAIAGFTQSLQAELAPLNISVTGIYPGKMATGIFSAADDNKDLSDALDPDHVAEAIEFIINFGKPATFTDLGMMYMSS